MAAVSLGVATASTLNVTSYASAAFTPVLDDLLVVYVMATATTAAGTLTSSTGLTFTRVTSGAFDSGTDTIYAFVADALVTNAASQTVTFDCTGNAATGCLIFVARVSGMARTGLGAIKQSKTNFNNTANTVASITFDTAVDTNNTLLLGYGAGATGGGGAAPTGWTQLSSLTYSTPTSDGKTHYRNSGGSGTLFETSSVIGTAHGELGVELDVSVPASPRPARMVSGASKAVQRASRW